MTDERREKDFEKIDNIEKIVIGLANDFKTHTVVGEVNDRAIRDQVKQLSTDIKEQRLHFDDIIDRNKEHFDDRINTCHNEIYSMLKDDYVTKSEMDSRQSKLILEQTKIRRKDIDVAAKDIMTRVKNFAAIISGTVILIFIILTYILGLK